jgi:hypothetical protein
MDIKQAIAATMNHSDFIVNGYLSDITPQELLARPCAASNHIAWQLGHLIASEHHLVERAAPGKMEPLPAGLAERHKKSTAGSNEPSAFLSKEEYQSLAKRVRANTLRALEQLSPADLDKPVSQVPPFCKTAADVFLFIGGHWLMHAGQWSVIRRTLGRPPLM